MNQYTLRDFNWVLIGIALLICGCGILQIYSATHDTIWADSWWKQIIWTGLGIAVFWIFSLIDYHWLVEQSPVFYIASVLGLLLIFAIGKEAFGSRRWIPLPGFDLQVSEFVKLVLILGIARFISELRTEYLKLKDLVYLCGIFGIPMLLVMKQPDLGTSLTYVPILAIGIFLAGMRWQHYLAIVVLAAVVLPVGYHFLKDYQKQRLLTFANPGIDPRGAGYQVIQSRIAIGAGGIFGKGVTQGSQTQLRFLPVPHNDFIVAAFGEEHGFVGILILLSLYFLLLMQIVKNAQTAPDQMGIVLSMGVAALLLFHILVNVGMSVGLMPVTGIPLPLMSYGGSGMLSMFLMLGLVNNVRLQRFVN